MHYRALTALTLATVLGAAASAARSPVPAAAAEIQRLDRQALDHFYNLEYDQALHDFRAALVLEPGSAAIENHIAETVLYEEMNRVGALESELYGHGDPFLEAKLLPVNPAVVSQFLDLNQRAMNMANAALVRDPKGAHAHYNLAVAWAMRGTLDFTLRHSYWDALKDAKTARSEALTATQLDPGFLDPQLILGVHDYVAGSLPFAVRMFSALIGYSGNKERGRATIARVAAEDPAVRTDAETLLAVIDRRDGLNHEAAVTLHELSRAYPRNPLLAVETAEALEAAGEHDAARAQYEAVITQAAAGAPGFQHAPLDKVWYDLGNLERVYSRWLLAAQDFDKAERAPAARPRYVQAAALAAGQSLLQAQQPQAARAELQRCINLGVDTPAGKAASNLISN